MTLDGNDGHLTGGIETSEDWKCAGREDTGRGGRTLNGENRHLVGKIETLKGWKLSGEDGLWERRMNT